MSRWQQNRLWQNGISIALMLAAAVFFSAPLRAENDSSDPYRLTLAEFNVAPTTAGVSAFLQSLHPSMDVKQVIAKLISELGDDEYAVRDGAMRQLQTMPVIPAEDLRKAVASGDAEVRWRAKEILAQSGTRYAAVLFATLKTIERNKIPGVAADLIRAIPVCTEEYLIAAARNALLAAARPGDAELLRKSLKSDHLEVRVAAAMALGSVLGEEAATEMKPLLSHADDRVRLVAARSLANLGNRDALEPLGKLLDSQDVNVRTSAVQTLRATTGQTIVFTSYAEADGRVKAADEWRKWIADNGATAKLTFPLRETVLEIGRTLVCYYAHNKVVEYDSQGKQTWEATGIPNPWACQGLPNGHRLVASYNSRLVIEYDASGKEVWRAQGNLPGSPFSVQRLENGNTLLACSDSQKVVEIDSKGDIKWEVTIQGRPMDARRLPDGKTLICLQSSNRVVEVDPKGNETWEIKGLSSPLSAQRLENGNTVVCATNGGAVFEYDRGGKVVWQQAGFSNPYDVQRLSNGNTLVAHNVGVKEIDRDGKTVWEKQGMNVSRVHRY